MLCRKNMSWTNQFRWKWQNVFRYFFRILRFNVPSTEGHLQNAICDIVAQRTNAKNYLKSNSNHSIWAIERDGEELMENLLDTFIQAEMFEMERAPRATPKHDVWVACHSKIGRNMAEIRAQHLHKFNRIDD